MLDYNSFSLLQLFPMNRPMDGDGFVLVYSVTERGDFEETQNIYWQIRTWNR